MNETSKLRKIWGKYEYTLITGYGIDIGCGDDPILATVKRFDMEDGDANRIGNYINGEFDFVFSSHCLEHLFNPKESLKEWWNLVRPGGHLIFIVPDEDLYEQGYWPSLFNSDHKWTFTISKHSSWSPVSINIMEIIADLDKCEVVQIVLQDNNYDRSLLRHAFYDRAIVLSAIKLYSKVVSIINKYSIVQCKSIVDFIFNRLLGIPLDQTMGNGMAQIQTILRKASDG